MIALLKICAVAATAALGVPAGLTASPAVTSTPGIPDTACKASVNLPRVLVLSQSETERHPVLTTSCPLDGAGMTILSSTDEQVDIFGWMQQPATTGAVAVWDQYDFDYVAGHTYHTDQSSDGFDVNSEDFASVTITSSPMVVKDATYVRMTSAKRSHSKVVIKGTTSQWSASGDYGSGATVRNAESVRIQRKSGARWLTVKTVRSTAGGKVTATFRSTSTRTYRLVIPSASKLNNSTSKSRRA